jgi:starch phosphorylase
MLAGDNLARAVQLARAKETLRQKWNDIKIVGVHTSGNGHYKVGDRMQVEALLDRSSVEPTDVSVQLYAGALDATGEIEHPQILDMTYARQLAPGRHLFTGTDRGPHERPTGFSLRVLPGHADMATPFEPGLIIWN